MKIFITVVPFLIASATFALPNARRAADFETNVARGLRLVKTAPDTEQWMPEADILKLIGARTGFVSDAMMRVHNLII